MAWTGPLTDRSAGRSASRRRLAARRGGRYYDDPDGLRGASTRTALFFGYGPASAGLAEAPVGGQIRTIVRPAAADQLRATHGVAGATLDRRPLARVVPPSVPASLEVRLPIPLP